MLARLAVGDLPQGAKRALLSAKLAGIPKSQGGIRVLGCGGVIRRTVFKQVAKEMHAGAKKWCDPQQFGLQSDGTGKMYRLIQTLLSVREGVVLLSVDQKDAFSAVDRDGAIAICDGVDAVLSRMARVLLEEDCSPVLLTEDGVLRLLQRNGFDQGGNLSPFLYCVVASPAVQAARAATREIDTRAEVVAFVGDAYFVATPEAAERGRQVYQARLRETLQVQENMDKCEVVLGAGVSPRDLPATTRGHVVPATAVVGTQVIFARAVAVRCLRAEDRSGTLPTRQAVQLHPKSPPRLAHVAPRGTVWLRSGTVRSPPPLAGVAPRGTARLRRRTAQGRNRRMSGRGTLATGGTRR